MVALPVWACISYGISVRRGCVCWCCHRSVPWELQSWNAALKGTSGCSLLHFDTSCLITSGLWMPAYRRPSTESTASPDSVGYNINSLFFFYNLLQSLQVHNNSKCWVRKFQKMLLFWTLKCIIVSTKIKLCITTVFNTDNNKRLSRKSTY